jgi:hypothetical protein
MKNSTIVLAVFLAFPLLSLAEQKKPSKADPSVYYLSQSFDLTKSEDGFDGKLVLRLDKKLKEAKEQPEFLYFDDAFMNQVKNGILEILDARGKVSESQEVTFFAALRREDLGSGGPRAYFIKELEAGDHLSETWGSRLFQVAGGHFQYLTLGEVEGDKTKQASDPFMLWSGGELHRGDWRIAHPKQGRGLDILQWYTDALDDNSFIRGDGPDIEYRTSYKRYHFDGKSWSVKVRKSKGSPKGFEGISVPEDKFPDESLFPE